MKAPWHRAARAHFLRPGADISQEGSFMPVLPRLFAALLLALPLVAGTGALSIGAAAQDEVVDEIIATVNGTPIRYSDIAMADEEMGAALAQFEPPVQFQYLLGMLIDRRVVALAAKEKHVDDDPAVKRRQDYFNEKALRDVYWVQLMQDKVSEEAIQAHYKKTIEGAPAEREAHARHILVETKAQAEKIVAEIRGGKSFEDAAREYSRDGTGADGGDLGWFRRAEMVEPFANAVFAMKPGEVSGAVQTPFGWHVIEAISFRDMPKPSLEEAHDDIVREIARDEGQKLMEGLRNDAKVEIIGADEAAPSGGRPQIVPLD